MPIRLEGWLLVPFHGQRRFALVAEEGHDIKLSPRDRKYDPWFASTPDRSPACTDLELHEYKYIELIRKGVMDLRAARRGPITPGSLLTLRLSDGAKVVFYYPTK